jgi:hypothetical protein
MGTMIDLENSKERVQNLFRQGKILFMPLFVTPYFLYAILLTKIRGIRAHRLGAVEIPMRQPLENGSEKTDQNGSSVRPQLDARLRKASTDSVKVGDISWY